MAQEIKIDGYSIYIEQLDQVGSQKVLHDSGGHRPINWTIEQLQNALKPAAAIVKSLREATKEMVPDEMELSMQFEMALSGETPVLKIVSAETKCQFAAKFVWKKGDEATA